MSVRNRFGSRPGTVRVGTRSRFPSPTFSGVRVPWSHTWRVIHMHCPPSCSGTISSTSDPKLRDARSASASTRVHDSYRAWKSTRRSGSQRSCLRLSVMTCELQNLQILLVPSSWNTCFIIHHASCLLADRHVILHEMGKTEIASWDVS